MNLIIIDIILFFIGFFVLIKGADLMIGGSVKLARFIGMSEWLIGVVIVGIGTSLPELAISLNSAIEQSTVGIGTIIGSNIFNMLIILGFAAFISPIILKPAWVKWDIPINILSTLTLIVIVLMPSVFSSVYTITRFDSLILLVLFVLWMFFMVHRKDDVIAESHEESDDKTAWPLSILLITLGLIGVVLGGEWVVNGAISVAEMAGVSKGLLGLTIVAIGTSIPEITVTFRALIKRRNGIAIGNIIGSNVFDILLILGLSALISPLLIPSFLVIDIFFLLFTATTLYVFIITNKNNTISRLQGLLLILFYFAYLIWVIIRG